jgi:hypothetical protein
VALCQNIELIGIYAFFRCSFTEIVPSLAPKENWGHCFDWCTQLATIDFSSSSIAAIGAFALYNTKIRKIEIGERVLSKGNDVAGNCFGVERVESGELQQRIGASAFLEAQNLSRITFCKNVTAIGESAFVGSGITAIVLPPGQTEVAGHLLENRAGPQIVVIGDKVAPIGDCAFAGSALRSLSLPDSLTSIPNFSFANTALAVIGVANNLTIIANRSIANCTKLAALVGGASLESIRAAAFLGTTALRSITFAPSAKAIPDFAFLGCLSLTDAELS